MVEAGPWLRPKGWVPLNDPGAVADRHWVLARLEAAGAEPPTLAELSVERGHDLRAVLKGLEKEGAVVPIEGDRWYGAAVFAGILAQLGDALRGSTPIAPSALREVVGVSRKFLMPLLEYCDRRGFTRREGDGRVAGAAMPRAPDRA